MYQIHRYTHEILNRPDIEVRFPAIDVIDRRFDNVLGKSKQVGLSLKETARAIKDGEPIYADKVSYLSDRLGFMAHPVVNQGLQTLAMVTLALTVAALIISVRNLYILTMYLPHAEAALWMTSSPVMSPPPPPCDAHGSFWLPMIFAALVIVTLVVFVFMMLQRKRYEPSGRRPHKLSSCIKIAFFAEADQMDLPLKYMPHTVADLVMSTEEKCIVPQLSYSQLCFTLNFDWSFFEIRIKHDGQQVYLPSSLPLSLTQAWRLKKILNSLTHLQLLLENGKDLYDIRTWSSVQITKLTAVKYEAGGESSQCVEQVFISPVSM